MKKWLCIALIFCVVLGTCTGCVSYRGEHKDLYTVAVNTVFATKGYITNGEIDYPVDIRVLETDAYGRTLFFYSEYDKYMSREWLVNGMAFVIMQKSDGQYVYYYPDVCYVTWLGEPGSWDELVPETPEGYLDELKEANDWNQEPDESRYLKTPIVDQKPQGVLRPNEESLGKWILESGIWAYKIGLKEHCEGYSGVLYYCERDYYGRELYYTYGDLKWLKNNIALKYIYGEYALIVNPDGTLPEGGIVKLGDYTEVPEVVSALKQQVGWGLPE